MPKRRATLRGAALREPTLSGRLALITGANRGIGLAIARALAPNPAVLLLDEPTSALDPELVNEVLDVIRRLAVEDGLTMIISTHQLRFADEVADRIVFISGGKVLEEGPAHQVLTRPKHPLTARFLHAMGSDDPVLEAPA